MKNLFYCPHINAIGGIETFLYEIALKYGQSHEIAIVYKSGDPKQIERYMNLVRCIKWDGYSHLKCDKLFTGYTTDIAHFTEYKEFYIILHCDFEKQRLTFPSDVPKDAKYLCVSNALKERNEQWLKVHLDIAYNPIIIPEQRKALRLISATRLTGEKGRYRMEQLAALLHKANIPFLWTVFSDDLSPFKDPSIVVLPPQLDILPYVKSADYLVQLSDTEAYSYSILEALCVKTPVIITPLPLIDDMGIEDGVNGYILPFDMNLPEGTVEKIANEIPVFEYTPKPDRYEELLAEGKPDYMKDRNKMVIVQHKLNYFDLELNRMCMFGDTHQTNYPRALMLENKGLVTIMGEA